MNYCNYSITIMHHLLWLQVEIHALKAVFIFLGSAPDIFRIPKELPYTLAIKF
jgi:hypothetical protein